MPTFVATLRSVNCKQCYCHKCITQLYNRCIWLFKNLWSFSVSVAMCTVLKHLQLQQNAPPCLFKAVDTLCAFFLSMCIRYWISDLFWFVWAHGKSGCFHRKSMPFPPPLFLLFSIFMEPITLLPQPTPTSHITPRLFIMSYFFPTISHFKHSKVLCKTMHLTQISVSQLCESGEGRR